MSNIDEKWLWGIHTYIADSKVLFLCKNTVAANTLPPQKAAILLRLALTGETSQEQLEALFEQY
jgi:L-asparaginase